MPFKNIDVSHPSPGKRAGGGRGEGGEGVP